MNAKAGTQGNMKPNGDNSNSMLSWMVTGKEESAASASEGVEGAADGRSTSGSDRDGDTTRSSCSSVRSLSLDLSNVADGLDRSSASSSSSSEGHDDSKDDRRRSSMPFLSSIASLEAEVDRDELLDRLHLESQQSPKQASSRPKHLHKLESKSGAAHFIKIVEKQKVEEEEERRRQQKGRFGGINLLPFISSPVNSNPTTFEKSSGSGDSPSSADGVNKIMTKASDMARHFMDGLDQERAHPTQQQQQQQEEEEEEEEELPLPPPLYSQEQNDAATVPIIESKFVQGSNCPARSSTYDNEDAADDGEDNDKNVATTTTTKDPSLQAKMADDISDIEKSIEASMGITNVYWHQTVRRHNGATTTTTKARPRRQLGATTA